MKNDFDRCVRIACGKTILEPVQRESWVLAPGIMDHNEWKDYVNQHINQFACINYVFVAHYLNIYFVIKCVFQLLI